MNNSTVVQVDGKTLVALFDAAKAAKTLVMLCAPTFSSGSQGSRLAQAANAIDGLVEKLSAQAFPNQG